MMLTTLRRLAFDDYSEMFPANVRYSGTSLGYQLGGAIAGFVPLVAASLVGAAGGAYWPIPALIALTGLIGFVCILLVRPAAAMQEYSSLLMQALQKPARRTTQTNVLEHIAGFLRQGLDRDDREELQRAIADYRRGELPLIAPLTLIRHHLRRCPDAFLEQQRFLELRPADLDTRRK
jgi:hypothetical protein